MSAAAASADQSVPKKGSKKLFIIIGVVAVLLIGGGAGGFMMWKKKAAEAEESAEAGDDHAKPKAEASHKAHKREAGLPPAYMPLDPFVVNLADRDTDRYAQIGITLEIDDPKFAEQMKGYMPAIRNSILMVLSHKTSVELLGREGKETLAAEIAREAVRPMGIIIDEEEPAAEDGKKKRRRQPVYNPVQQVHFSSFIVQ